MNAFSFVYVPYVAEYYKKKCMEEQNLEGAFRATVAIVRREVCYYGAGLALLAFEASPYLGESSSLCRIVGSGLAVISMAAASQMYDNYKEIRNAQIIVPGELSRESAS